MYADRMETDLQHIGQEIRRIRNWRGMTLEAVAGLAGISKGYLSKIENGNAALERRKTLHAIASALQISPAELVGSQFFTVGSGGPDSDDAKGSIPDIRLALLQTSLDFADEPPSRPVDELMSEVVRVEEIRQTAKKDVEVGRALPPLITDLHAVVGAGGNDRILALKGIVQTSKITTQMLKNLGAVDLAYVAADRGHQAAVALDDPLYVAVANYSVAQSLIGLGAFKRAGTIAGQAAELLRNASGTEEIEAYGMMLLVSAFCSNVLGDDPEDALREAQGVATHTAGTNAFWLNFSATNVDQWRMSIALEAEDPVLAAEIASRIDPDRIPAQTRRTTYYIDHARALHALHGHDAEVVDLLRAAEKLGPIRTRHNIWVRQIVTELMLRARRNAGGRELRGLADRMGLLHAV